MDKMINSGQSSIINKDGDPRYRFFEFMAQSFPVQCSSDEFYWFPRAEPHPDALVIDNLDQDNLIEVIAKLKQIASAVRSLEPSADSQHQLDTEMVRRALANALVDLEILPGFKHDPTLYLKVAMIGAAEAFSKSKDPQFAMERIAGIPALFSQAGDNLEQVGRPQLEVARSMALDAVTFLNSLRDMPDPQSGKHQASWNKSLDLALSAVQDFARLLEGIRPQERFAIDRDLLQSLLQEHYGYDRELEQAEQELEQEYHDSLAALEREARSAGGSTWQEVILKTKAPSPRAESIMSLIESEVAGLKYFLISKGLMDLGSDPGVSVLEVPPHLRALRSGAAYAAPAPGESAAGRFYVSPWLSGDTAKTDDPSREFFREYRMMCAHEAYPGHHLLDFNRLSHHNPFRRQIEMPFFYEGWACYGESLMVELGYFKDHEQRMLCLLRRLRRSVRGQIDLGLQTGRKSLEQAAQKLVELGAHPEIALSQVTRYALNPGYQMCYSLGRGALIRLREKHGSRLGLKDFHRQVLGGGQMGFELLDQSLSRE